MIVSFFKKIWQCYYKSIGNYANFKGRSTRSEFWVFNSIVIIVRTIIILTSTSTALVWFWAAINVIPLISLKIRRLHDINFSGWWFVLAYLLDWSSSILATMYERNTDNIWLIIFAVIFFTIPIVVLGFIDSKPDNKYGKNSKKEGLLVEWHENGQKKLEANYINGKKEGLGVEWHENGQKKLEANFKNGKLEGLQVMWFENGQKESEGNFKNGKFEGLAVEWFENGQKNIEVNYKNGKLEGLSVGWHENGQKKAEINYKNGKQIGETKIFNKVGK